MKDLSVCFEDQCVKTKLGIVVEKNFNYTVEKSTTGVQESIFKVENSDVSKVEYVEYNILDEPEIKIIDIEAPSDVVYNDQFKISFLLRKESNSNPKNLEITLTQNNFENTWNLKELLEDRKLIINLLGKDLKKGVNEFNIEVKYEDRNGKNYEYEENFNVELTDVTIIQNIFLVFNQFALFLENFVQ